MKQTTILAVLIYFFGLTQNLCAQSSKPEVDEATRKRIEYQALHMKRSSEQAVEVYVADKQYNHREKEILEKLNTEAIPADFPAYKPEYTDQEYTTVMNVWYKEHPALLKKGTNTNQQK